MEEKYDTNLSPRNTGDYSGNQGVCLLSVGEKCSLVNRGAAVYPMRPTDFMNEIKIETRCTTHTCTECGEKLYPQNWKKALGFALLITFPLFVAGVIGSWMDYKKSQQLDPPYCYQEQQMIAPSKNDILKQTATLPHKVYVIFADTIVKRTIVKRSFVDCPY